MAIRVMLKEKRNTSKYVKKVPQKYLEKEVSAKKLQKCMSKKKMKIDQILSEIESDNHY
jgi:hypothetical protein